MGPRRLTTQQQLNVFYVKIQQTIHITASDSIFKKNQNCMPQNQQENGKCSVIKNAFGIHCNSVNHIAFIWHSCGCHM